jgi:hypothetical protein
MDAFIRIEAMAGIRSATSRTENLFVHVPHRKYGELKARTGLSQSKAVESAALAARRNGL